MNNIFKYWYLKSPNYFWESFLNMINNLEASIGVLDNLHNLHKPLFQDYTLSGRFVGFLLRLVRIFIGAITYLLISFIYGLAFLIWIFFPIICLTSILGAFLA